MTARFRFTLLSEDKNPQSLGALRALVRKLVLPFEEDGRVERVSFGTEETARPILRGNNWRSGKAQHEPQKRDLIRFLASEVERGNFVLFHHDGDVAWSARPSPIVAQFDALRVRVEQLLAGKKPALTKAEVTTHVGRLIECVPYYSIEAWVYQATERAAHLCNEHHAGKDADKFIAWANDRPSLDEQLKPKEATCLRDQHTEALARAVDWETILGAKTFFTAFAEDLRKRPDLADPLDAW